MKRLLCSSIRRIACFCLAMTMLLCQCTQNETKYTLPKGDADNGKLALPDGFEAVVVVDSVGKGKTHRR